MKEQRVKRQRKTKKVIFKSKKEFVKGHSFMTSSKKSKFLTPTPFPLYPQSSNFDLSRPHSWTSLTGIQNPRYFRNFLQNFNNKINIVTYSFFFANTYSICYFHMDNETDRKANSFSPTRLL